MEQEQLNQLTSKLRAAFGERLVSVILYGSAAAGDWQERASDLNVLCVLKSIGAEEVQSAAPIFQWWSKQGNVPPVLLTEDEVRHSTDCFPIEFSDIQERRHLLWGEDIVASLNIDFTYYRAFVERELRGKQMRLRQKSVELHGDRERLVRLMADSISTFCALARHALILGRQPPRWKKPEILAAIAEVTGSPMRAALELVALRESGARRTGGGEEALLGDYLRETDAIVRYVDSLAKQ